MQQWFMILFFFQNWEFFCLTLQLSALCTRTNYTEHALFTLSNQTEKLFYLNWTLWNNIGHSDMPWWSVIEFLHRIFTTMSTIDVRRVSWSIQLPGRVHRITFLFPDSHQFSQVAFKMDSWLLQTISFTILLRNWEGQKFEKKFHVLLLLNELQICRKRKKDKTVSLYRWILLPI